MFGINGEKKDSASEAVGTGNRVALTYDKMAFPGSSTGIKFSDDWRGSWIRQQGGDIDINVGGTGDIPLAEGLTATPNINLSCRVFCNKAGGRPFESKKG